MIRTGRLLGRRDAPARLRSEPGSPASDGTLVARRLAVVPTVPRGASVAGAGLVSGLRLTRPRLQPLWVAGLAGPLAVLGYAVVDHRADAAYVASVVAGVFVLILLRVSRMVRDVERQALELLRLSGTDALTGLPNRRAWEESYAAVHRRCATEGVPVAVLMIDLDHFKAFNDTHGHLAGDQFLQDAVRRWQAALRPGDLLARWGGEEFAACLPGCRPEEAVAVAARLLTIVPYRQTASVGLAVSTPGEDARSIVARADAALYAAKRAGRARTVVAPQVRPLRGLTLPEWPAATAADG